MGILKDFSSLAQKVLTFGKELEQNRADVKELRRDLQNLTLLVQRLVDEIKLSSQQESSEREKLALRLQIELLKFERRLSPVKDSDSEE
jgi:hypothetical protein